MTAAPPLLADDEELRALYRRLRDDEARCAGVISLTANESCLSATARAWQASALAERYHLGVPGRAAAEADVVTVSGGGLVRMSLPAVRELEHRAAAAARRLFDAHSSDLRPLSGIHATICVVALLTAPGDLIMSVDPAHGGHNATRTLVERLGRRSCFLPWSRDPFAFDPAAAGAACRERGVAMVLIDLGTTPFPLPVRALREAIGRTPIVYDGSHNLGLIAGGAFPNPLREGADVLSGSAHKSFPGPQKAMVHFAGEAAADRFMAGLERALISSQHTGEALALYTTLLEMDAHAAPFAAAMVANARRLALALARLGLPAVVGRSGAATESAAFWLPPPDGVDHRAACAALMGAGLATNARRFAGRGVLRIGVQHVTRRGMGEGAMDAIALLFARVLLRREAPERVRPAAAALVAAHPGVAFSFDGAGLGR